MEQKFTLGNAIPSKSSDLQPQLWNAIKRLENIEKRLENIEKLLREIQQKPVTADEIETDENRN